MIAAVLLAACSMAAGPVPQDPLAMSPQQVVESFYNWELTYPGNSLVDRAYRDHPLLSQSYQDHLDELVESGLHFSPLLCAQDVPSDIDAHAAQIDGSTAVVPVTTSFAGHSFAVELKLDGGEWVITNIRCQPSGDG